MRNRYLHPGPFVPGECIELTGEEFHHAVRVARCHEGEEIELLDGRGAMALAVVEALAKQSATVRIAAPIVDDREARVPLTLAMALIQPEKFELALQKATELGVARIVPILTAHGEVRAERVAGKRDRWEKIVLEAVKQSGRSHIPLITEVLPFEGALTDAPGAIIFDADGTPAHSAAAPSTLFIGPEGGWSGEEIALARRSGATVRSLGPRRLRAETAAIAALAIVGAEVGNL
jgi:16S rRNA (uracil1498-N3)-methyltransferase